MYFSTSEVDSITSQTVVDAASAMKKPLLFCASPIWLAPVPHLNLPETSASNPPVPMFLKSLAWPAGGGAPKETPDELHDLAGRSQGLQSRLFWNLPFGAP